MIITRTPLRISIGGGGTDLPSYYREYGGFLVSVAISKYIYIGMNRTFTHDYFLKYSELERVKDPTKIKHNLIREVLRLHPIDPVEIVSLADIPSGTGLGSSGTFTVGLLRAVYAFKKEHISARNLAEEACKIEIDILKQSGGKQDQYIAAFGGLTCFEFEADNSVKAYPLNIPKETLIEMEEHLMLFFTGYSRSAQNMLKDQDIRTKSLDQEMIDNMHYVKLSGQKIKEVLERGDTHTFAKLMHEHWLNKKKRSKGMSKAKINHWYDVGIKNGALGGKLVGAGGGGFLLFYSEDPKRLRKAMQEEGLAEVRFSFDFDGSIVTTRE